MVIVSYMMKTVNTVMGLSLFVVLGGMALAACKTAPVVQSDKAPACCTEDAGTEQTPTSSTTTAPTDLDAGVVVAPPTPSATDNK
jgi:hypothetical protein